MPQELDSSRGVIVHGAPWEVIHKEASCGNQWQLISRGDAGKGLGSSWEYDHAGCLSTAKSLMSSHSAVRASFWVNVDSTSPTPPAP